MSDYRERGYMLLPGIFSSEDVESMNAALVGISDAGSPWEGPWAGASKGMTLQTRHNIHLHPPWDTAVGRPALLTAVQSAMGAEPIFTGSTLVGKPARSGAAFPPHQDAAYYGGSDLDFVIATVFLDEASEDNGTLRVWPGTHLGGGIAHSDTHANKKYVPLDVYPITDAVSIDANAGDVLLMNLFVVHGSGPNTSDAVRRTVRLLYRSH